MVNVEVEKIEIEKVLKRVEDAENRKDVDAMFEEMTEDSILQKCGTPQIQGLDAWREDYEEFFKSGFISTSITFGVTAPAARRLNRRPLAPNHYQDNLQLISKEDRDEEANKPDFCCRSGITHGH